MWKTKKFVRDKRKELAKYLHKEGLTLSQISQIIRLERTYLWRIIKSK